MRFLEPQFLWLLPAAALWFWWRQGRPAPALALGQSARHAALPRTWRVGLARLLPWLRLLVVALGLLALARPQWPGGQETLPGRGADLMLALDLSTSMLAVDRPGGQNRLDMAREVLTAFLRGRPGDRVGLVAFAARPYPAAPLTLDHEWLQTAVSRLKTGDIEDGTALGDALLAALRRLQSKPGEARRQAVILLTDGRDNASVTAPEQAAAAARALGVKVHVIGIGGRGEALIPMENPLGGILHRRVRADLDEAGLQRLAAGAGGRYFRADDAAMLARVFREIDRLEKAPHGEKTRVLWRDLHPPLLLAACLLLLADLGLRARWLRRL